MSPTLHGATYEAQARRAGWQKRSYILNEAEQEICGKCASEMDAKFRCALWGEMRSRGKLHESFGDPAEHLCEVCYATCTAKEWEEAHKRLSEAHRWDFS